MVKHPKNSQSIVDIDQLSDCPGTLTIENFDPFTRRNPSHPKKMVRSGTIQSDQITFYGHMGCQKSSHHSNPM